MLRLFTLGELRLETDGGQPLSRRRKPLILLTYLARRARPAPRAELAALLWGERDELRARHSLRQALLELHRILGDRLVISHDTVHLVAPDLEVDATQFEQDVDAGRLRAAVTRWSGDFLADADDRAETALRSWLEPERAGMRRRLSLAFERLLDEAERRGERRESIAIARGWTQRSPLDESASLRLVNALRRDGRSIEALACHSAFVTTLREELDVEPSREFARLADTLGTAARDDSSRRWAIAAASSTLPFVGRGEALGALVAHWRRVCEGAPLLAIVRARRGMGARRLREEFVRWIRETRSDTLVLAPGRPAHADDATPFSAARHMLAELEASPAMGGLAPERLADLAALLPGLRVRFANLPRRDGAPAPEALAAAVREALEAASEDGPILLDVGRLGDADTPSRTLLRAVAAEARGPILFLCSVEGDGTDDAVGVAGADRSTLVIALAPLTVADVRSMLEQSSRLPGDDRDALAAALHRDTDGIPGYVVPAIETLIDERLIAASRDARGGTISGLDHRAFAVPAAVRASVQRDLGRLDESARRLVEVAAVLDSPFEPRQIAALAELSPDDMSSAMSRGLASHLVQPIPETSRLTVAPPIVQRAVYALVPPLRRDAYHARVAESLRAAHRWRPSRTTRLRIRRHEVLAGRAPTRRAGRRVLLAAGVLVSLVAIGALTWRAVRSTPRREQGVAIFPFTVSGSTRLHFLRAGMADLLSTSLDGAAGLHTIDARTVIAATSGAAGAEPLDADRAREIAARLGATQFVLGTIVGAAGRLQTSAALYGMRSGSAPIARVNAEGSEAALFDVVDRLTAQLAVAQGGGPNERLAQLAAVTTSSLEALKAYLEGRNAYRANDLYSALSAFQRAVAADSSFALAWYGLASTASWMLRPDLERPAVAQAVRQSGRLSARDRTLIEGFAAYSRGAADSAEAHATSIVQTYDDTDGWVLLGEVLYHHNWKRGRSLAESRQAWERVLALDPTYWPALQHLSEVASLEGHVAEADSLLARYEAAVGTPHVMLASRALRAYSLGDTASRKAIATQLANDRGFWLALSVWYVSVLGRNVEDAAVIARPFVDPLRPPHQQAFGRVLLAHLALARGQWKEARRELAIARSFAPTEALEYETLLSMAPFLSTPASELTRVRDELLRRPLPGPDNPASHFWPHTQAGLHPLARSYLAGLVAARTGDEAGRGRALAELASVQDPTGRVALGAGYASSIRAEHEHARGHATLALASLERGTRATPFVAAWTSGFVSQPYERYMRAELLHALGRDDEALRWYGTFAENSPYDLVYLAPALYRQGQIHDRRGERQIAIDRYRRFLVLWKNSDSELRPMTDDATTRLAQLR